MFTINFKPEFKEKIINGEKTTTIRKQRKTPFQIGKLLYIYTNSHADSHAGFKETQTKKTDPLIKTEITDIKMIKIDTDNSIFLDGKKIKENEVDELIKKDGFNSKLDFFSFFRRQYDIPFHGVLIYWAKG